jgi:threonine/homoserine/homoserine lactone efflux protein
MPLDLFLALTLFAFVTSITPGPNNLMLLASGVNFGFRRTIPHMLGIGIGFAVMLLGVGLGLGALLAAYPAVYQALRVASIAYMLWLAWKIANSGPVTAKDGDAHARPMTLLQAALFQWINPKAWAMALTGTAAYTVPSNYLATLAIMVVVFALINLPSVSVWTVFGVALRRVLQDPVRVRIFNAAMALLLVTSIWPLITELR